MTLRADTKSRFVGYLELFTALCLKAGIPVLAVSAGFLIVGAVTGRLQGVVAMPAGDREQMISTIELAALALVYSGAAVTLGAVLRFFNEEAVGHILAVVGLLLFFGSPWFFVSLAGLNRMAGTALPRTIVDAFRVVGAIVLVPGFIMLLRDAILRIWTGLSAKRAIESRQKEDVEETRPVRKGPFSKVYSKCWEMDFCRAFVRKVCPAFEMKKPCWKVRVGCYCDEKTILRAMMDGGKENPHTRGIMKSMGIDSLHTDRFASRVRKSRCKQCVIYAQHQRQKYQILSPLVFPAVVVLLWVFHERIAQVLTKVIVATDGIMCCLAYKTGPAARSMTEASGLLVGVAFVWLGIVTLSYALRILEYLVFDLQV